MDTFLSFWQDTLIGGFPLGVIATAFQIGGLLAYGLTKYWALPAGFLREYLKIAVWTGGITVAFVIYSTTLMWPGLLTLLNMAALGFAYGMFRRSSGQRRKPA